MPINRDNLDEFTTAYIEAALWSTSAELVDCSACGLERQLTGSDEICTACGSKDVHGADRSMQDMGLSTADIAEETLARMVANCDAFQVAHGELLTDANLTHGPGEYSATSRAGHDFWLTRNGHGCGFWDGDWIKPAASTLDAASKAAGEVNLYVGDDGRVYA